MGTATFTEYHQSKGTAQEVFSAVAEESRYQDGVSYSGEIGCTYLAGVRSNLHTHEQAKALARQLLDRGEPSKGDTIAIRVGHEPLLATRKVTKRLRIPAGVDVADHVKSVITLKPGEVIARVDTTNEPFVSTRKVSVQAPKGATETRYFIINPTAGRFPRWDDGHPSQAAARARLTELLPKQREGRFHVAGAEHYEIIAITRRVGGAPLVEGKADHVDTQASYEVTIEKRGPMDGQDGWLFVVAAPS